ncbi:MAG: UvrD-helicase domain-containing protein [Clostridiales bacterium]|nr:UvrD-helicase domain-containing protein [Clostridiales bacterium]
MGLFSKLLKKKEITADDVADNIFFENPECKNLWELKAYMDSILSENRYISKSEYRTKLLAAKKTVEYFGVLQNSRLLDAFCKNNGLSLSITEDALSKYINFEALIEEHNESFISRAMVEEKNYLDNILHDVDPKIKLDEDQRRVVLTDEDYCLVIAGAGAGKTTTVAAKVKYLVEKQGIKPSQILVISFTNKAVQELRDKINKDLAIECPIATFHSTGNAILRKQTPEKLNIVDSSKLYFVLQDYFKSSVLKNESLVNNLILFFSSYFDAPYEGEDLNNFFNKIAKSNFSTMRSDLNEFKQRVVDIRTKKSVTIQSEVMRSRQEVEIANFLYLNNIDYEYEPMYKYDILFSKKPYTPDFIIRQGDKVAYIEHFGITQDGKNDRFSDDQLEAYKKAINDKINLHRQHNTKLIYTFSQYSDRKSLLEHLQEEIKNNGFELRPRSNKEVMEKLVSTEENRYIRKLINLVCRFISNFKTNGFTVNEFSRMYHSTQNVRTRLFLDICNDCYLEYERYLKENNAVDFEDMINDSAQVLRSFKEMKKKLDFKYIIVDEYQDISRQRFDLITALSEVTDAKIIAVGDDWQSIYAFSGSDITLFTKFEEKMGYAKLLKIAKTYRNSQEVIDIAGNFIQKNKAQISKELTSSKNIVDPVIIYTYDGNPKKLNANNKSGANYAIAHAVEVALKQIIEFNKQEGKPEASSILLLGRFGFDGDKLEKSGLFEYINRGSKLKSVKYPKLNITFMTAHASKGLGYDNVIVVNGRNETYGFPSKIEDDPVLAFVIKGDRSIDYAEERRLFYVAMTRTKNRVYFIAPEQNPSEFLLEIKHDYKNVVLCGNWNEEPPQNNVERKTCPICGYPMQYRYKNAYGLRLFICTNEPEICGFMTNEYKAGKLSILKCDQCRDGYLIVKPGKENSYFLGCTNYKKDGSGCGRFMAPKYYYDMFNLDPDSVPAKVFAETVSEVPSQVQEVKNQPINEENKIIKKACIKAVMFEENDLNDIIYTVLQCLSHISEKRYYGIGILADVLRGANSKRLTDAGLNNLPEYGKLKQVHRDNLIVIIEWLIENHFILKTKHPKYPVLHPTYDGMHYYKTMTPNKLKKLQSILQEGQPEI